MSILSILSWLNNCIHRKTLHMISKQLIVLFCAEKIFTLSEQSFSLHCFTTLKSHRGLDKNQYTTLTDNWNNWSLICFCMVAGEGQWRMSVIKCSQLFTNVFCFLLFSCYFYVDVPEKSKWTNRKSAKALSHLDKMASEGPRKGPISVERMAVRLFEESWENKPKYLCLHIERGEKRLWYKKFPTIQTMNVQVLF